MHSDLEQAERDDVMFKFKSGQYDVLVATDIVARGIDIDDIEMVINYDVPHDTEDYVHRIGRTARANRDGRAITFVSEEDQYWFQQIEKFLEKVVDKMPLPEECGEGPEYIKLNKPKKKGANGRNNRRGNGKTARPERTVPRTADRKTATRLLTSASQTSQTSVRKKHHAATNSSLSRVTSSRTQSSSHSRATSSRTQSSRTESQPSQASSQRTATARSAAITATRSAQAPRTMFAQAATAVAEA